MNLIEVVVSTLSQVKVYLQQLPASSYSRPLDLLSGASIGQHTRHILEFYDCLIAQHETGEVNYDIRERDNQIETDPQFAMSVIDRICEVLPACDPDQVLILAHGYDTAGDQLVRVKTTFARELVYNVEHAIHHLAMIKIGLKILSPAMKLPSEFGVAPSTIRHKNKIN
jgi:hypothetical protein